MVYHKINRIVQFEALHKMFYCQEFVCFASTIPVPLSVLVRCRRTPRHCRSPVPAPVRAHHASIEAVHWLPVQRRIEFKLAVLICKSLNGLSPQHLMDDYNCQVPTGRRRLRVRSPNVATCDVPRTRASLVDRFFTTAAGRRLWYMYSLPLQFIFSRSAS